MSDPTRFMAEHLEEMVAAAEALLATVGEHKTRDADRRDPAEYVPTHEADAMRWLASQVAEARLALIEFGEVRS